LATGQSQLSIDDGRFRIVSKVPTANAEKHHADRVHLVVAGSGNAFAIQNCDDETVVVGRRDVIAFRFTDDVRQFDVFKNPNSVQPIFSTDPGENPRGRFAGRSRRSEVGLRKLQSTGTNRS